MRRTIYASKADDLRKAMSEYDATTTEMQGRYNQQEKEYRQRINAEKDALEQEVLDAIGPSSIQDIRVNANLSWLGRSTDRGSDWDVSISVNDRSKWEDKTSLAWHYDIKLNDQGEVVRETGSWSGLKAATADQLDDLKESVRLIEKIGSIDWPSLLHRAQINYEDFIDESNAHALHDRQKSRPDFEKQIVDAEVEEYVGQPVWIKLSGSPSSTYGRADRPYYAHIKSETPARYVVDLIPESYINTDGESYYKIEDVAVSKQNFLKKVVSPVETVTR